MSTSDLLGFIDVTLNHWWLIVLAIAALATFLAMLIIHSRNTSRFTAIALIIILFGVGGAWLAIGTYVTENERNTVIRVWMSETYGINENAADGNISRELTKGTGSGGPAIIDDQGRALTLVTTVDDKLVLIDAGGRELPHIDDEP